ncbi:Putative RxLR effector [Phytophthora palmivora]|uniref:RxLR effector protein n=1 Tax=Phytophthora palmivora TaxID=4796 RepID=A0A2P4XUU0_9STRA|nr:Putative RxLR effector [Phytophthora palmivora]
MRLSQVLVMVTVPFLSAAESILAASEFNQSSNTKLTAPGGPSLRFLRAYSTPLNDEGNSEERALTKDDLKYLAEKAKSLGFSFKKANKDPIYVRRIPQEKYLAYQKSLNRLIDLRKTG